MQTNLALILTALGLTVGVAGVSGMPQSGPAKTPAAATTADTADRSSAHDAAEPAPADGDPWTNRSVEIECGGFDAQGDLVNPHAAQVERAPLGEHGRPEIPEVCGGYTVEGTFIGDD